MNTDQNKYIWTLALIILSDIFIEKYIYIYIFFFNGELVYIFFFFYLLFFNFILFLSFTILY